MRILALSDLHLGKEGSSQGIHWEGFHNSIVERAREIARRNHIDVLWFGGDAAESSPGLDPGAHLREAIDRLDTIPADHKVWVAGNNDLECLTGSLRHYAEEFQGLLNGRFHLLDTAPLIVRDFALVGSIGWFDGSLYAGPDPQQMREDIAEGHHHKWGRRWDYDRPEDFFWQVQDRLSEHLQVALRKDDARHIVIGTHYAPDPSFCLYGHNPEYEYKNWFMGFNHQRLQRGRQRFALPGVTLGITGHTHRSDRHTLLGCPVYNISGPNQPTLFEVEVVR